MFGSDCRLETHFDEVFQTVPNQGLLIIVPMAVGYYVREDWLDSRNCATLTESDALFSVTNVCVFNLLRPIGA